VVAIALGVMAILGSGRGGADRGGQSVSQIVVYGGSCESDNFDRVIQVDLSTYDRYSFRRCSGCRSVRNATQRARPSGGVVAKHHFLPAGVCGFRLGLSALESERVKFRRPCAVLHHPKAPGADVLGRSAAKGVTYWGQRETKHLGQHFRIIATPPRQP
jgi:hypothetical protein